MLGRTPPITSATRGARAVLGALNALVVMGALLTTTPASAQKRQDETTEARARFNEGIKFADEGNHEAARLKFSQAWSLLKSPAVLYNLARSEQLSGHTVDALEHYRLFMKMASDPKVTEQQKQRALENIAELSEKVGQIDVDAAPNAQITIDGKAVEWNPQGDPIPVVPGPHEVTASLDGSTNTTKVDCTPGTVAKARLRETSKPAPVPTVGLPTDAALGSSRVPTAQPKSAWSGGQIAGLAIAGGGLAAIGLGVYFHLDSSSAGDDADTIGARLGPSGCRASLATRPPDCSTLADLRDQQDASAALRTGLWIGGGVMVIGGAALFLLTGHRSPERSAGPVSPARRTGTGQTSSVLPSLRVLPSVAPRNQGLTVVGTF